MFSLNWKSEESLESEFCCMLETGEILLMCIWLSGCKGLWSSGTGVGGYQNNKKQEGFLKPSSDWSATAWAYEQTWHWDEVLHRYLNSYSSFYLTKWGMF